MANDAGRLAPPNTVLSLADQWFDGNVVIRPGASFTNNAPTNLINQVAAPAAVGGASVLYSTAGGVLASVAPDGQITTIGGVVQSQTTTVTVANTASATALQSYTVPANDPVAGAVYNMMGYGLYSDTGTPTLTFTLYWGGVAGTTLATFTTAALGSGVSNVSFSYDAMVTFRSTTSAWANITLSLGTAATGAASSYVISPTTATAVTTTAANALTLGVTWSAASASNTISLVGGVVERLA